MGYSNKTLTLSGSINLTNVNVKTVGGRSGLLIGMVAGGTSFTDTSTITATKSSLSMYECEQNTGEGYGLDNGEITSWVYDGAGNKGDKTYDFDATKDNDGNELSYNNIVKN